MRLCRGRGDSRCRFWKSREPLRSAPPVGFYTITELSISVESTGYIPALSIRQDMASDLLSEYSEYFPRVAQILGVVGCFVPSVRISISGEVSETLVTMEPQSAAISGSARTFSIIEFLSPKTHAFMLKTTAFNSPLSMLVNIPKYLISGFSALLVATVGILVGAVYMTRDTETGSGAMISGLIFFFFGLHFASDVNIAYQPGFALVLSGTVLGFLHSRDYV